METYDKRIVFLRKRCVVSLREPKFMENIILDNIVQRAAWNISYEIVWKFTDVLGVDVLSKYRCLLISNEISELSEDLSRIVDSKTLLMIWLWIGELIESWIEWSIEDECYEAAENLKRLLTNSFL